MRKNKIQSKNLMTLRLAIIGLALLIFLTSPLLYDKVGSLENPPKSSLKFGRDAVKLARQRPHSAQTSPIHQENISIDHHVRPNDILFFSYGVDEKRWTQESNIYEFSIKVSFDETTKEIFNTQIDPKFMQKTRGWINNTLPLNEFDGKKIRISFFSKPVKKLPLSHKLNASKGLFWGGIRLGNFIRKNDEYNIILVSLDTLRADHLGINGYPKKTSPHIDAIAKKGVNFTEAISQAPWTKPSHMSLFTGLTPSYHGVTSRQARHGKEVNVPMLTEILQKENYLTQAYTGSGAVAANFGFYHGFDHYVETYGLKSPDAAFVFGSSFRWIEENKKNKFFLFLHTYEIHSPYIHTTFGLNKVERYDSGIYYTDQWVGELYKCLERNNLINHTILIITSDHGEDLGTHFPNGKHGHTLFDELIRVPMIFYCPQLFPARMITNFQSRLIDIKPTLLDILGIKPSLGEYGGQSLLPLLRGGPIPKESIAISEAMLKVPEKKSIRYTGKGRFKYILDYKTFEKGERINPKLNYSNQDSTHKLTEDKFYNLNHDRMEKKNIISKKSTIKDRLKEQIVKYVKSQSALDADETSTEVEIEPELKEQLKSLGY